MKYNLINFSEIDKFAIDSYCRIHHEDESKNLGDITQINTNNIEDFDFLVGGSPCQDYSIAGQKNGAMYTCKDCGHKYNPLEQHYDKRDRCPLCNSKNIEITRSSLIVHYLRFLREKKPKVAIYENVKNLQNKQFRPQFEMFLKEINEYGYNYYWTVLNAKDYGIPQNRERIYVVIIRKDVDNGCFKFPLPKKLDLSLKDLLESYVDDKYYMSQEKTETLINELIENNKIERNYLLQNNISEIKMLGLLDIKGNEQIRRVYDKHGICPTINTMQGGHRQPKIVDEVINPNSLPICFASRGRYIDGEKRETKQNIEFNKKGTINTLTTIQKDNYILESVSKNNFWILKKYKEFYDKNGYIPEYFNAYNCKEVKNISATITANCGSWTGITTILILEKEERKQIEEICKNLKLSYRIRKLTPRECFRLMGFTDSDYDNARYMSNNEQIEADMKGIKYKVDTNNKAIHMSDSQLYKQAGNSIVVNVLLEIYKSLYITNPSLFSNNIRLCSLFSGIGAFEKALSLLEIKDKNKK